MTVSDRTWCDSDSIYSVSQSCATSSCYTWKSFYFFFSFPCFPCAAVTLYVALIQLYFKDTEHSSHFFHSVLGTIFIKKQRHKINTILNICERFFSSCCISIFSFTFDFHSAGNFPFRKTTEGKREWQKADIIKKSRLWFSCILFSSVGYAEITPAIKIYLPFWITTKNWCKVVLSLWLFIVDFFLINRRDGVYLLFW